MFTHFNLKQVFFHFFFFILFVAALFLYKERLFMDTSLTIFKVLNDGWFFVEDGKVSLIFSQLLPLMAYYLGFNLKLLLMIFSLSHVFLFYLIFLFINYKLKDEAAAMVLILFLFIAQLWTFYTPMVEINYGVVLSILFYSILRKGQYHKNTHYTALIIIAYFILSGSYLNYLLFLFILIWDIIDKGFSMKPHAPLLFMLPLFYVLKSLNYSFNESSESVAVINDLNWEGIYQFVVHSIKFYPEIILAFMALMFFLNKGKRSIKNKAIMISFGIYILIIIILGGTTNLWYLEMSYKPLLAIVFIAFFYEVYLTLNLKGKKMIFLLFSLVIFVRAAVSWSYGEHVRESSDHLERLVYTSLNEKGNKFLINKQNILKSHSSFFSSTSIETLLLSSIKGKEHSMSIALDSLFYENLDKRNQDEGEFYADKYGFMPDSNLNERFFNINGGAYHHLNSAEFKYPKENLKDSVKLELMIDNNEFKVNTTRYLLCRISNTSQFPLPSNIHSNIRISYHIYNAQHEVEEWDGIRTPIEMDINSYHDQYIEVKLPEKTGLYYLQPDIVIEGELWVGFEEKYEIKVF